MAVLSERLALGNRSDRRGSIRHGGANLKMALRLGFALALAGLIGLVLWVRADGPLQAHTDVVGRTTWVNFNIYTYIDRFYIVVLVVPIVAISCYALALTWGPLSARPPNVGSANCRREAVDVSTGRTASDASPRAGSAILRLVPPMVAIYLEIAIAFHSVSWSRRAFAGALAYGIGTILTSAILARVSRATTREGLASAIATVNTYGSISCLLLLAVVSDNTQLTIESNGRTIHYGWFPWWLAIAVSLATVTLVARWRLRNHEFAAIRLLEVRILTFLVGPVVVFLLTAVLPGPLGTVTGFDDSQAVVGANLMFHQGLWPWRDILLFHGFLSDGLFGQIGMSLFSHDEWGSNAGFVLLVQPLSYVGVYLFAAYFLRRKSFILGITIIAIVFTPFLSGLETRYVISLGALVLLDRTIRLPSFARCSALMASVVLTSILVPEATVLMLGVVGVLVIQGLHRWRLGEQFWLAMRTIVRCLASGLVVVAVWTMFLLAAGAFSGFVSYYRSATAGHELLGAFPLLPLKKQNLDYYVYGFLPVLLYLATVWRLAHAFIHKIELPPRWWATIASASFVPLIYQLFLDRADLGHAEEMWAAVVPLVVLSAINLLEWADDLVLTAAPRLRLGGGEVFTGLTLVVVVACSLQDPAAVRQSGIRFQAHVPVDAISTVPLGYETPGATNIQQIITLRAALKHYMGQSRAMFDFANEMGVSYYLLDYSPGARYYYVAVVQTLEAQRQEITDLERSRPRIVIYYDNSFGLPVYDGIISSVRNYEVSQYLLDHYKPLLDVDGQLLMMRNDLVRSAPPPPSLEQATLVTKNLYFQVPACDWGFTPNFLDPPSAAETESGVSAPVSASGPNRLRIGLPAGTNWTSFRWLEVRSASDLPAASFDLSDQVTPDASHGILFKSLPQRGKSLYIRVGSCSQWHGFTSPSLNLLTTGPVGSLSVRLIP